MFKPDTALFDFDGTIMDTNELIIESWKHTVRTLTDRDISTDEILGTLGEAIAVSMSRIMPDVDPALAIDTYRDYQTDRYLDGIHLFDGVRETFAALSDLKIKIGLVTSRLANSTFKALDHFDIRRYFDAIVTAEDTTKYKPDPEPILLALKRLGAEAARTVYLGDTVHDILAAKAAGVYTILAGWSAALPPEKRRTAPAPDLVVHSMTDLSGAIKRIKNAKGVRYEI